MEAVQKEGLCDADSQAQWGSLTLLISFKRAFLTPRWITPDHVHPLFLQVSQNTRGSVSQEKLSSLLNKLGHLIAQVVWLIKLGPKQVEASCVNYRLSGTAEGVG